ncbi:MAG: hypothetical protein R3B93_19140 [Bacteroidia bacterium]
MKNTNTLVGLRIGRPRMKFLNPPPPHTGLLGWPHSFTPFGANSPIGAVGNIRGYIQNNFIDEEDSERKAYGYIYSEHAEKGIGLMDFHRHDDRLITLHSKNLPPAKFNNDFYQIKGHGVGGSFRPYRSKHGVLLDPEIKSKSSGVDAELEFGMGNLQPLFPFWNGLHAGLNARITAGNTTTGPWSDGSGVLQVDLDDFSENHSYTGSSDVGDELFEPYYFKMMGELNTDVVGQQNFYLIDDKPEKVELESYSPLYVDLSKGHKAKNSMGGGNFFTERGSRKKRNTLIASRTAQETESIGYSRYLYEEGSQPSFVGHQEPHHMAEYVVTNPMGMRYVYGYPVYTTLQKEVTFAYEYDTPVPDMTMGPAYLTKDNYLPQKRNGVNDEFFKSTTMPAYAHDHLLNLILGPDYIDVDPVSNPGPSEDDLGYWVKIHYDTPIEGYKWRIPYQGASYMPGRRNDGGGELADDKGFYSYGTKDLTYPTKIETATHEARFITSSREDGLEAHSELAKSGEKGSRSTLKLDRIELYSKVDLGNPIMEVHFAYDYSLCKNVKNNTEATVIDPQTQLNLNANRGKLTLKKVWFTYYNSSKGELTPYEFSYQNNYDYEETAYNSWGGYKPSLDPVSNPPTSTISPHWNNNNLEFPFVDQTTSKTDMDNYASAWGLSEITLPSGSVIQIDYESDDYSYVQDKRAAQMVEITGIGTDGDFEINHTNELDAGEDILYVQLHEATLSAQDFHDQYLEGLDKLYFKAYIKLNGVNPSNNNKYPVGYDGPDIYDFVTGYCEIDKSNGSWYGTNGDKGWIKIRTVDLNDSGSGNQTHPFSAASWQHTRLYRPGLAHQPVYSNPLMAIGQLITSMVQEIPALFTNYNTTAMNRKGGQTLNPGKSFIRLNTPTHYDSSGDFLHSKYGGGHRVKEIRITDQWENNGETENIKYGQMYEYTTTNNRGEVISSGVAENEPGMGVGENPLKVFGEGFEVKRPLTNVDNNLYTELPLMTPYYPSPRVGYSKVTVKNIDTQAADLNKVGKSVYTFYTAKDFPVREDRTILEVHPINNHFRIPILGSSGREELTASQGFVYVANDMHGKPRSSTTYRETSVGKGDFISRTLYHYRTDPNNKKRLKNEVNVLTDHGVIEPAIIGRDYEQFTSMRQTRTAITNGAVDMNFDIIWPLPVVPIFSPVPQLDRSIIALRTAVNVKIIHEYGILEKVETSYMNSKVISKDLLYDAETGGVLLSSVTNEFDNPVYTYNYAGHWYYSGLEPAYQNIHYVKKNVTFPAPSSSHYEISVTSSEEEIFTPGDELLIIKRNTLDGSISILNEDQLLTVDFVNSTSGKIHCFNEFVIQPPGQNEEYDLKIIRSGHRNQQSATTGKIVTLTEPVFNPGSSYYVITQLLNQMFDEGNPFSSSPILTISNQNPIYTQLFAQISAAFGGSITKASLQYVPTPTGNSNSVLGNLIFRLHEPGGTSHLCFEFIVPISENPDHPELWTVSVPNGAQPNFMDFNTGTITQTIQTVIDGGCNNFAVTPAQTLDNILHADAVKYSDDWSLDFHDGNRGGLENLTQDPFYNPYKTGEKGIFRVESAYAYKEKRNQVSLDYSVQSPDLTNEGVYDNFTEFTWNGGNVSNWIYTNSVSLMSPYGFELENTNALGIPSSALYGYANTMVSTVSANAGYYEVAETNFEDIVGFESTNSNGAYYNHFGHFDIYDLSQVTDDEAYTGSYSLRFDNGSSENQKIILDTEVNGNQTLQPTTTESYMISLWLKEEGKNRPGSITLKAKANITTDPNLCPSPISPILQPSGVVINGWELYEAIIEGSACSFGTIELEAILPTEVSVTGYVDAVIFKPEDSKTTSYVYDWETKRLLATFDDQNLPMLYYYDAEGKLTHVMKDTKEGRKLLQEYNNHVKY